MSRTSNKLSQIWWVLVSLILGARVQGAFYNCTRPGLVALTFDDGPGVPGTNQVLDVLKNFNVTASFFVNGLYNYESDLARYKRTITRIYDEGHQLGSHSWNHTDLTNLSRTELLNELEHLAQVVRETIGVNMTVFRPPLGAFTEEMETLVQSQFGYSVLMWNVDTRDWATPPDGVDAYKTFYANTDNNHTAANNLSCIGLHHDPLPMSASLTEETLTYLTQVVGLRVVTLAECLEQEMYVPIVGGGGTTLERLHLHLLVLLSFVLTNVLAFSSNVR